MVLTALALVIVAIAYVLVQRYQSGVIVLEAPEEGGQGREQYNPMQQFRLIMALLMASLLGIIAFLVGAYLVIRFGRAITGKNIGGAPTPVVDAWAQARVSEKEVDDIEQQWSNGRDSRPGPGEADNTDSGS